MLSAKEQRELREREAFEEEELKRIQLSKKEQKVCFFILSPSSIPFLISLSLLSFVMNPISTLLENGRPLKSPHFTQFLPRLPDHAEGARRSLG